MTIEFQCDGCQKILRTADDKAGRTARCPQCGKELTVPEAEGSDFENSSPPPPPRSHLSDFEELTKAPPRRSRQPVSITCPMCGEVNESTTDRCLACGEPLDVSAAARGEVSTNIGDIWNRAWEVWTANLGINVAAAAIFGGIWIGVNFLLNIAFQVGTVGAAEGMGEAEGAVVMIVLLIARVLISLILYWYLFVGFAQFAIENVRRENPGLESLFITGSRIVPIMGAMFCYFIITALLLVPAIALLIGGTVLAEQAANNEGAFIILLVAAFVFYLLGLILAMTLFWPVPFMLADRSSRYLQSLADAPRMGRRFFGLSALLAVTFGGLSLAGYGACCVGLLFSVPLAFILQAVAYDHCRLSMEQADRTTT